MNKKILYKISSEEYENYTINLENITCVYMLLFNDASYYIGHTKDLKNRVRGHLKSMDGSNCVSIMLRVAYKNNGLPKLLIIYKGIKEACKILEGKLLNLTSNDDLSLNDNKSTLYFY